MPENKQCFTVKKGILRRSQNFKMHRDVCQVENKETSKIAFLDSFIYDFCEKEFILGVGSQKIFKLS